MEVIEAIKSRKSIRGFKPDPVPKAVLKDILEIATRSPSAMNTQPWEITVVTGKVLDDIKRGNVEALNSRVQPQSKASQSGFKGVYRERQVALAVQLFGLMGIAREDKEKRAQWMERGFRYFDAPAAIILSIDSSLIEELALIDIGALCQSICITALSYGLYTCIEDQGVMYPHILRKYLEIPDAKHIPISIAIGYPDWELPANRVESGREPIDKVTKWYGFE